MKSYMPHDGSESFCLEVACDTLACISLPKPSYMPQSDVSEMRSKILLKGLLNSEVWGKIGGSKYYNNKI